MGAFFKSFFLLVVLTCLGIAGFWIGHTVRDASGPTALDTIQSHLPDVKVSDYLPPAPLPPAEPQKGPYAVSPIVAPLARSVWADDLTEKDGQIIAMMSAKEAEPIRAGQEVIFYARRPFKLLTGVSYIDMAETTRSKGRIIFAKPDNLTEPLKRVRARILTMETVGTKQLPLSALSYDDEGRAYVWKLERVGEPPADPTDKTGDYAALYHPLFAGIKGDDAFEAGPEVRMGDMILAKPPADIQNGDIITIDNFVTAADLRPLTEQARDIQRAENTRILKAEIGVFEEETGGSSGPCNIPTAQEDNTASGVPPPVAKALKDLFGPLPPTTPQAPSAPTATAPASTCNSCGTTY